MKFAAFVLSIFVGLATGVCAQAYTGGLACRPPAFAFDHEVVSAGAATAIATLVFAIMIGGFIKTDLGDWSLLATIFAVSAGATSGALTEFCRHHPKGALVLGFITMSAPGWIILALPLSKDRQRLNIRHGRSEALDFPYGRPTAAITDAMLAASDYQTTRGLALQAYGGAVKVHREVLPAPGGLSPYQVRLIGAHAAYSAAKAMVSKAEALAAALEKARDANFHFRRTPAWHPDLAQALWRTLGKTCDELRLPDEAWRHLVEYGGDESYAISLLGEARATFIDVDAAVERLIERYRGSPI